MTDAAVGVNLLCVSAARTLYLQQNAGLTRAFVMIILDLVSQNESSDPANLLSAPRRTWPSLSPSRSEPCDGKNPDRGIGCVLGYHHGYHRDSDGAEWLDAE
ncbi:hypothetical protein [Kribbella kalugense]|uniref:hypothetical protein n=1 Tax=Kribbella kalugense TaxID=2512221 RepID=UPI00106578D9|nr:hypothetical protein [Kribbella kalugense]